MRSASPCAPVLFECSNGCSAVLSFSRQGENQYKALIHVQKTATRLFGTRRNTISEAVDHLFDKHKTFVSQKELHRVKAVVRASDPLRYGANHVCKTPPRKHAGPQPSSENTVQVYHQMYFFFAMANQCHRYSRHLGVRGRHKRRRPVLAIICGIQPKSSR